MGYARKILLQSVTQRVTTRHMNSKEFRLSLEQTQALERIAVENHAAPADLVALAVDALIAEAALHQGWLPLPKVYATCAHPTSAAR